MYALRLYRTALSAIATCPEAELDVESRRVSPDSTYVCISRVDSSGLRTPLREIDECTGVGYGVRSARRPKLKEHKVVTVR